MITLLLPPKDDKKHAKITEKLADVAQEVPPFKQPPVLPAPPKKIKNSVYYDLIIGDPSAHDLRLRSAQWYHASCGSRLQIGDNAYIKCLRCGVLYHIKKARYNWREHEIGHCAIGHHATYNAVASALCISSQFAVAAGKQWLMNFLDNLGKW
jgi:hypothetical protein